MIVSMKHLDLVCLASCREATLRRLRALGEKHGCVKTTRVCKNDFHFLFSVYSGCSCTRAYYTLADAGVKAKCAELTQNVCYFQEYT